MGIRDCGPCGGGSSSRRTGELTQVDDGDAEHPLLFVAEVEVLERCLVGLFADDIREDLGLPLLDLLWERDDLADGFDLTDMVRGCRTLKRSGGGPARRSTGSDAEPDRIGAAVDDPAITRVSMDRTLSVDGD